MMLPLLLCHSLEMRKFANLHIFYHPLQIQSMQAHIAETEIANICPLHQASFIFLLVCVCVCVSVFFASLLFHFAVRSFCTANVVHLIFVILFFVLSHSLIFVKIPLYLNLVHICLVGWVFARVPIRFVSCCFSAYITNWCGFDFELFQSFATKFKPSGLPRFPLPIDINYCIHWYDFVCFT